MNKLKKEINQLKALVSEYECENRALSDTNNKLLDIIIKMAGDARDIRLKKTNKSKSKIHDFVELLETGFWGRNLSKRDPEDPDVVFYYPARIALGTKGFAYDYYIMPFEEYMHTWGAKTKEEMEAILQAGTKENN